MHSRIRFVVPLVVVVALLGGFWWWNGRTAAAETVQLSGSGTIEAEQVLITSEVSGRVQELLVDEGQEIKAGATLATLDRALLEAQMEQADAAVAVAEANLALLAAGAREEEIATAQAQVDQAQAARDGAANALANAQAMIENPQELALQVAQARANRDTAQRALEKVRAGNRAEDLAMAQSAAAQAQTNLQATRDRLSAGKTQAETQVRQAAEALTQAQARFAQAKSNWERAQETGNDPLVPRVTDQRTGQKVDNTLSDGQREAYYAQFVQAEAAMHQAEQTVQQATVAADAARQAEVTGVQSAEEQQRTAQATLAKTTVGATREDLSTAQTNLASAQRLLDLASATAANPIQLHAAADNAQAQLQSAEAQLDAAKARLALTESGTRREQIDVAKAQVQQARATRRQIEVQLAKTTLVAPRDGIVLTRTIHQGEQATPGAPLLTLGALDTVQLTIYIAESEIGRVKPGQVVAVSVNSFPNSSFKGTVTHIADEAQFTPRNVQTREERATTVFAVRVDLANTDHALKPGMPADAVISE